LAIAVFVLGGCVNQAHLDAWVGQPVEALDTHSWFLTVPMVRTISSSGIEIRDYVNAQKVSSCYGTLGGVYQFGATFSYANYQAFTACAAQIRACHNIFYIRDGLILEYAPVGRNGLCYTAALLMPEARYLTFGN
jgi:hypothetical protein